MGLLSSVGKVVGKVLGTSNSESSDSGSLLGYLGLGALNAGVNVGNSFLNNYFSKEAASREYGYTKSLMDYQNVYNTPLAQRQRLEEAGYNPNLFYNTGANSSASGSVHVQAAKANPVDLLAAYNLDAQANLLRAQQDATFWQAGVNQYNSVRQNALARMAQYDADYAQAEHELWKATGKIPERYLRSDWSGELTGALKGLISRFLN